MNEKARELGNMPADRWGDSIGMTLRQYYAGLAMQGIIIAGIPNGTGGSKQEQEYIAHWAVQYADVLLNEIAETEDYATKNE